MAVRYYGQIFWDADFWMYPVSGDFGCVTAVARKYTIYTAPLFPIRAKSACFEKLVWRSCIVCLFQYNCEGFVFLLLLAHTLHLSIFLYPS